MGGGRARSAPPPPRACLRIQKDGCAQRTGAHARPKPTSLTIFTQEHAKRQRKITDAIFLQFAMYASKRFASRAKVSIRYRKLHLLAGTTEIFGKVGQQAICKQGEGQFKIQNLHPQTGMTQVSGGRGRGRGTGRKQTVAAGSAA